MRISTPFDPRARHGYALVLTLVFFTVSLMTLASIMWWASSSGKVVQRNELFTSAEAAAEAGTEMVVALLDRDWTYGQTLQAASFYAALVPAQTNWPMSFQYSDGSGNINRTGVTIGTQYFTNQLGATFTNLSGYVQNCTITSTALPLGQLYSVPATVQQVVRATVIPLFQFAIFYNMNLEICPGAPMTVKGPVFCNQGIWAGTPNVTFNSTVAAAGWIYDQATDPTNLNPWCSGYTQTGTPNGNFAILPIPNEDSLNLPIGTNNSASAVQDILNLPPGTNGAPNSGAYTTNGQIYLFNQSDLIISNAASGLAGTRGTNVTIWFQDPTGGSPLTQLQPNVTNVVGSVTNRFFSFVTNVSYYDYRESDTVQAVQINVAALNAWLTNTTATGGNSVNSTSFAHKGHGINSIYVYNNVPLSSSQLPAVRLVNGAQLPSTTDPGGSGRTTSGLTVATPNPLYVKGNYNAQTPAGSDAGLSDTTYTYPAALMGDAISILSPSWNDSYNSGTAIGSRTPTSTTINAACLEGIVPSAGSNYSGGVENFMRLNENWTGVTLTYNGSIVVMFSSQYATNIWPNTGVIYNPPTRNWAFDANFSNPSKLPANTPKFYKIIRNTWNAY